MRRVALESTERRVHICGSTTRVVGGVPGARNDFVNVVCTMVGAYGRRVGRAVS